MHAEANKRGYNDKRQNKKRNAANKSAGARTKRPKPATKFSRRRLNRPPPPPLLLIPPQHRRLDLHGPHPRDNPPPLPLLIDLHLHRAVLAVHLADAQHRHPRPVNAAGLLPALDLVFGPAAGAGGGRKADGGELGAVVWEGGDWWWGIW